MESYRTSSHCTYDIKYHIVWITKYRKPILDLFDNLENSVEGWYIKIDDKN